MSRASKIIRWITRIISGLIILIFLVFMIGEGVNFSVLSAQEIALFAFIPGMLSVGIILAWFREVAGGAVIVASVLLFNLFAMIFEGVFSFDFDFGALIICGLAFLILGYQKKRQVA